MDQKLKDKFKAWIEVWISLTIIFISICALFGIPYLFLNHVGIGEWQVIVCGVWFIFWISLVALLCDLNEESNKVRKNR